MNSETTTHAPLRVSERAEILALQIAGLITRQGAAQFEPTLLAIALDKTERKQQLTTEQAALVAQWDAEGPDD